VDADGASVVCLAADGAPRRAAARVRRIDPLSAADRARYAAVFEAYALRLHNAAFDYAGPEALEFPALDPRAAGARLAAGAPVEMSCPMQLEALRDRAARLGLRRLARLAPLPSGGAERNADLVAAQDASELVGERVRGALDDTIARLGFDVAADERDAAVASLVLRTTRAFLAFAPIARSVAAEYSAATAPPADAARRAGFDAALHAACATLDRQPRAFAPGLSDATFATLSGLRAEALLAALPWAAPPLSFAAARARAAPLYAPPPPPPACLPRSPKAY
jgi:hypothetical protein